MEKYQTFQGDSVYCIECTGDAVVGDEVRFSRAVFSGSYKRPTFCGYETITGKIISDSYGAKKQQHTFTILLDNGEKTRIKGRNLYRNKCFRKLWIEESERELARAEKHSRGDLARAAREERLFGWDEILL